MERLTQIHQFARALFELCPERALAERVGAELEEVTRRIEAAPETHAFLFHPEIPLAPKLAVLRYIVPPDLTDQTNGLLQMLVEHRELRALPEIHRVFSELWQEKYGLLEARIEVARPLDPALRASLKIALERLTGHTVTIEEKVTPEVLGGARIHIEDRIIDATVNGRLSHIARELAGTPAAK